jgi:hypothetical protein
MKKSLYLILFFFVTLLSCTGLDSNKEEEFSRFYDSCEMNTLIKLSFEKRKSDNDGRFDVYIDNLSIQEFVFSYSSDLEIWYFDNSIWSTVSNNIKNLGSDELYIDGNGFRAIPINPSTNKNITIRIVVTGNYYENGLQENQCFGAFADYSITP